MAENTIITRAPGQTCSPQTVSQPESGVKVVFQGTDGQSVKSWEKYGMITNSFTIAESDNVAVTPTVGKNIFVYCTGQAPVSISLKGVIGYIGDGDGPKAGSFPEFYKEHSVSNSGKLLQITIDNIVYRGIFTGYNRDRTATQGEVDSYSLQFVAVRAPK